MTAQNERNDYDEEPQKSKLLPMGDNKIVEVLVAMFRATQNSKDAISGGDSSERTNQRKDAEESG